MHSLASSGRPPDSTVVRTPIESVDVGKQANSLAPPVAGKNMILDAIQVGDLLVGVGQHQTSRGLSHINEEVAGFKHLFPS
ncbi:hypothetical protein V6N13_124427 [Hibiscus sabdariffa]